MTDRNWYFDMSSTYCEFCSKKMCQRALSKTDLEEQMDELSESDLASNKTRFEMYRSYTMIPHGSLGRERMIKAPECADKLILLILPLCIIQNKYGFNVD